MYEHFLKKRTHHDFTTAMMRQRQALQMNEAAQVSTDKIFVVIRGFPGSGKTTLAKRIEKIFGGKTSICSEDKYHTNERGEFQFKPDINWQTRDWCAREVVDDLKNG